MDYEENVDSPDSEFQQHLEPEVIIRSLNKESDSDDNINTSLEEENLENGNNGTVEITASATIRRGTVLCVYTKMNKLGACCYTSESHYLQIFSSVYEEGPEFVLMRSLYDQIKPTILITGSSCSKMFARILTNLIEEDGIILHRISPKHFNYENCKTRVLSMKVPGDTAEDRELFILSSIDLNDEECISAVGALISFLEDDSHHLKYETIQCIKPLYLCDFVYLDEETYINLQVFNPVEHPSGFKWNNKRQDQGISLYNLLSRYCGKISLSHLRLFLTRPTTKLNILEDRHQVIQFYNDQRNYQLVDNMKKYLHNMSTLPLFLSSLRGSTLRGVHWKIIYKNIHYAALVGEMCKGAGNSVPYLQSIGELLTGDIYALANHIYRTIDFDAMENSEKFVIKYGVRKQLDVAKEKFHVLQETIDKITPHEFSAVPTFVTKIKIVYIPEIRFLLAIPYWQENLSREELELPNLEYKFSAFKTAYYKSKRCKEMDSILGDPQLEIMQEESEIILELLRFIEENLAALLTFIRKLIELDCIFALAALAREHNFVRPMLLEEKTLDIVNGRHPLLSIKVDSFIANNLTSRDPMTVKVLYGANSSGKTIYLKQTALLVYMAHIGSFLPADEAKVGIVSNIHVHMKIIESVASKSSSFLSDIRRLSALVYGSGGTSLAILDEVCKGTNESSSIPIISGLLRYFTHIDLHDKPHVLLATHLDLPKSCLLANLISFISMNFIVKDDEITFLYKVVEGTKPNLALEVAILCGASKQTIQTAFEVIGALRTGESVYPYSLKRVMRRNRYNEFLKRFSKIKISKPEYLEKIKKKIIKSVMTK